jgi:hypothetical protein
MLPSAPFSFTEAPGAKFRVMIPAFAADDLVQAVAPTGAKAVGSKKTATLGFSRSEIRTVTSARDSARNTVILKCAPRAAIRTLLSREALLIARTEAAAC